MKTSISSTLVCTCCKRELLFEEFYYNHRTHTFDKYCKECRKKRSRQYRKECRCRGKSRKRLTITEIEDSPLRIKLILSALEKIRASIQRKRKAIQESEYRDFDKNDVSVKKQ